VGAAEPRWNLAGDDLVAIQTVGHVEVRRRELAHSNVAERSPGLRAESVAIVLLAVDTVEVAVVWDRLEGAGCTVEVAAGKADPAAGQGD
jgi:hypothetical protein